MTSTATPRPAGVGVPVAPSAPRRGTGWVRVLQYWLTSYRRTWRGSLATMFIAPLLYLGSLGYGLGSLVDAGGSGRVAGVAYAAFVAPGVLTATAMQTAIADSTYPVLGARKWQRQYHAMLASPLTTGDLLAGHHAAVLARVAVGAAAFTAIGALLGAFASPWVLLALPVAVLCGAAHSLPVMALSIRLENDSSFNLVFRFGVVPMFLFAGTFFPVEQLPAGMRPVAWVTPLWHATEASRALALGRLDAWPLLGHVGYLALWTVAGALLARAAFRKALAE